ncbi:MAG: crosslink repair DNA glycosylase YcaQ family protein [Planctomycetota bacterium]
MSLQRMKLSEFRRRVVAGSFPQFERLSDGLRALKFVQADPIRAPARAQDLILRQRVSGYSAGDLERSFPSLDAEEGFLFAYGFMTPEVWRDLRFRPRSKLKKLEREILDAVAEMGEVHPRDLDERFGRKSVQNYWGGKSQQTKRVLEDLHHHGYLRVSRREKGIRVYQLPKEPRQPIESPRESYRRLLLTTAKTFGPTTKPFLLAELRNHNHLLSSRSDRSAVVDALIQDGELEAIQIGEEKYLWRPQDWPSQDVPERVRILAPFDPLVRDRDRFTRLWDWTYRFEAYVPAAKRERGYYAMPVLWNDKVIGWANAEIVDERLSVSIGYLNKRPRAKSFRLNAEAEIQTMAEFLGLQGDAWQATL